MTKLMHQNHYLDGRREETLCANCDGHLGLLFIELYMFSHEKGCEMLMGILFQNGIASIRFRLIKATEGFFLLFKNSLQFSHD